ncbi:hypothetical protein CEN39_26595 [Fischerella thermalis CCMEE 5201]|jgi:hypothetical protein|nr:hypothetical protein CEN39_26595 [Fischerella thermalis CCMEE 5201]
MDAAVDLTLAIPGYCLVEELYYGSRAVVDRVVREVDRQPVIIKLLRRDYPTFNHLLQFRNQYAIARQIVVEKHGRIISVNSVPNEGAEFTMRIPVKAKVENSNVLVETEVVHVPC